MKAIETRYKGYRFRSRLEARWAVFFDALDMRWDYEPQGFELDNGEWYLPDFWVPLKHTAYPDAGYWVEIKPKALTPDEHMKCRLLAIGSGHNVCVLVGQPWPGEFYTQKWSREGKLWDERAWESHYERSWRKEIEAAAKQGIHIDGPTEQPFDPYISYPCGAAGCNGEFISAYRLSRAARFEHGERPFN